MISYTEHSLMRMQQYGISREEVERVLRNPSHLFFDLQSGRYVAVGSKNGHDLVVVYEKVGDGKIVVTTYHTSKFDKIRTAKLTSGRWVEL